MSETKFNFSSYIKRYILKGLGQWVGSTLILSIIAGFMSHSVLRGVLTFIVILPFWGIVIFTPFILIYFNHRKYNRKSTFLIAENRFEYSDKSGSLSFTGNDIKEVSFYTLLRKDLGKKPLFWQRISFTILYLKSGEKIFISCFLFDAAEEFLNDINPTNKWVYTRSNTKYPKLKKRLLPVINNNLNKQF